MEILVNIFLEVLIEGTAEVAKSRKAPKLLRKFALSLIISTMLLLYGLAVFAREDRQMMWTFIFFGSLIAYFLMVLLQEYLRMNKLNSSGSSENQ